MTPGTFWSCETETFWLRSAVAIPSPLALVVPVLLQLILLVGLVVPGSSNPNTDTLIP